MVALEACPLIDGDAKEEGRPPRWKDGLTRSFVHCSTHRLSRKEGVEASG